MTDNTNIEFGIKLKKLMDEQDVSLRGLEAKTGIPFNTINDYVHGRVAVPLKNAKLLADALNEDLNWLAGVAGSTRRLKSN